jgi:septum formation protein
MSERLILASASPRRRELLARVGVAFDVEPAAVDETAAAGEGAIAYAVRVAADKAGAVAAAHPSRWVLAADTVVEIDGDILGKPEDDADARRMIARLAGRVHRVTTAFAIRGPGGVARAGAVTSDVSMRAATGAELDGYVASGEWRGKAGGYAVQGIAAALVDRVDGSITNVIGLPLAEVVVALAEVGAPGARLDRGEPA